MQPTPDGRAGAGGEGRIKRVDVEGQVDRIVTHYLANAGGDGGGALLMHAASIQIVHPQIVVAFGADTDLDRARGIHHPGLDRLVHEGSMVDPAHVVILPEVGMRIELNHRQGAVFFGIGLQDGQCAVVVAAQHDGAGTGRQNGAKMGADRLGKIANAGIVKGQIAVIDDIELPQRVIAPAIGRVIGLQAARLADGAGTETGARAMGDGLVERYARDHQINARQILGVTPPQEGRGPAKGILIAEATQILPGKGLVYLCFCIFQRHDDTLFPKLSFCCDDAPQGGGAVKP